MSHTAVAATSVSQYGITWTFSEERVVGQFVNGDWWVVGPVTLSDVDPRSVPGTLIQGTMLNPIPNTTQGLTIPTPESAAVRDKYAAAKDISLALPYKVPVNCSIFTVSYNPDYLPRIGLTKVEKTYFKEVAVLTVLQTTPPPGSFRPPYAGTNKTIKKNWNESQMDYGVLGNFAPPNANNVPNQTWMEEATKRPLFEMNLNWLNSNWKATWDESKEGGYPRRSYGREISHISAGAGLFLQTNVAKAAKRKLAVNMCQWGIDVFGLLEAGMEFQGNGGHNHGRLLPIYVAARMLHDSAMLERCDATLHPRSFQEFNQHWYVAQKDIDTPRFPQTTAAYTPAHLGMPEWSSGGSDERQRASSDWNATAYRFINGAPNCGVVATIILMNGRNDIKHFAFFDYISNRYYKATKSGAYGRLPSYGDSPTLFTRDMWDSYVAKAPSAPIWKKKK